MSHSQAAAKTIVRINGFVRADAHVLSVDMTTGGRRLGTAIFEILATGKQKPVSEFKDLEFKDYDQDEVEISTKVAGGAEVVTHWGFTTGYTLQHSAQGEVLQTVSRQEPHLFGIPLEVISVLAHGPAFPDVHLPCVFNEEIDGQVFPNQAPAPHNNFFLMPESARTPLAQAFCGGAPRSWTLQSAA